MEKYDNILAKSSGMISLKDHSIAVACIAKSMCKFLGLDKKTTDFIIISSLTHDVGKIVKTFQNYILGKEISTEYIPHNILSWAVLSRYVKNPDLKHVFQAISTHHSEKIQDIKNNNLEELINDGLLSVDEINKIISFTTDIINYFDPNLLKSLGEIEINDTVIAKPKFYEEDDVDKTLLYRGILVSSDRLASSLSIDKMFEFISNEKSVDDFIQSIVIRSKWELNISDNIDVTRYNEQVKIVEDIIKFRTTILKAPAGYGKTISGLLWALKQNRKIIWVCPRNEVAENVYKNILDDLNLLGIKDVGVELFLTGKRQKCTDDNLTDFSSDIIVTNIDNYEKPTVKNISAHLQFITAASSVVFDEFHENSTQEPLFALFVNLCKMRLKYTNSKTLFLSATPSILHKIINTSNSLLFKKDINDTRDNEIHIYPNLNSHLPAIHTLPYKLIDMGEFKNNDELSYHINKMIEEYQIKEAIIFEGTVANSQIICNRTKSDINIHANFTPEDRKKYTDIIYDCFGKHYNPNDRNKIVSSTSLLGCAANISTKYTFINITSPEDFIQRALGRNNRFKEYTNSVIFYYKLKNQSHQTFVDYSYSENLSKLWYEYLKKECVKKSEMIADDLYVIYNNFNILYDKDIKVIIKADLELSLSKLSNISPKHYNNPNNGNNEPITIQSPANTIGLRSNSSYDKYFLVKNKTLNKFILMKDNIPPSNMYKNIHEYFDEDFTSQKTLTFFYREIIGNSEYDRFTYNKSPKYAKSITTAKVASATLNRPYICTNWYYSEKYGLIKNKTREQFL